ncbi:hypothetical protein CL617_01315 [archaeon]|jgi:hypothetical protein|nr:hypothetical protein [archaeon]|tara:strand:+ start:1324 stop:1566 length:243 start_codon:yes stop_codon:yes gene_type:complete
MGKLELTDEVLKQFATLTILNERFRNMYHQDQQHFKDMGEEVQRRYNLEVKPVLEPFAEEYSEIRQQMSIREHTYKMQIE